MKRGSTLFLKMVLLLIGVITATVLLWFPQTEGRAAHLDIVSVYKDPFIIYLYTASTPFFVALYQAMKLLGLIDKNKIFSQVSVQVVRNIKYCAIAIVCLLLIAIGWVRMASGEDDPAGAMAVGTILTFVSTVIATATAVLQSLLQNAVDIKSENDLTV